jgi:thioredoxin-related protein
MFGMMWPVSALSQSPELKQTDFEKLPALQAAEARPVFLYLTADWCTYCKQVENSSYKNDEIIRKLNEKFYFISFNIEERADVRLGGRKFSYKPSGKDTGVHELAEFLGTIDGTLSTPTFIILSPAFEVVYRYGGFLDSRQIKTLLDSV